VRQKETRKIPKSVIQNPSYLRHERLGWNYRMSELTAAVILGQTERAARLVKVRLAAADAIADELKEVSWLTPQESYPDSTSSYWAKAYRLNTSVCSWQDFYSIFLSYGGRGVYSAWALGYMEPAFQQLSLQGREKHLTRSPEELFSAGTSPVAEGLQAEILAFRTNEWSKLGLRKQMRALRKTVREINLRIGLPSEN
jgi:perosamine synthetase